MTWSCAQTCIYILNERDEKMKKQTKERALRVLTFVIVCSMIFTLPLPVLAVGNGQWTPNGYTLGEDGTYVSGNSGESTIAYNGNLDGINTVEGKFLYKNNPTDGGSAYMGFQIFYDDSMFFIARMYLNSSPYYDSSKPFFRAQKLIGGKGYDNLGESARLDRSAGFGKDTWIDFKVVLYDDNLEVYVNGEKMIDATGFGNVEWKKMNVISGGEEVHVKDLAVGNDLEDDWTPNGYTLGENRTYSSGNNGESTITYNGSLDGINTVEGKFLYKNNPTDGGSAYMGFQIFYDDSMFFIARMYLNSSPYYDSSKPFFRAQKLIGGKGYDNLGESARLDRSAGFGKDTWIDFKLVLYDNTLVMYANGEKMIEASGFGNVEWKKVNVISGSEEVMVKDLAVSNSTVTLPDWIVDSTWTVEKDGEETVYTTESESVLWYAGSDVGDYNTIEADVRYKTPIRGDGGINLQINHTGEGGTYIFNLAPNRDPINPVARLFNRNSTNVSPLVRREISSGFGATGLGDWIHLKFVFDENAILCYVNDTVVYKSLIPETGRKWVKAGVNTFLCPASVKNIKLSKTDIDFREFGYVDLEFADSNAVGVMDVINGSAEYLNGQLIAKASADHMTIESPVIEEVPGNRYSMFMPLRNTFAVRLKNSSSAERIKLSFRTSESGEKWYSKEFEIAANSEYRTYFFNVSDLSPSGYLRQFRIEFIGSRVGTVAIDAITFEREEPLYNYAGKIESCTADPVTKTVKVIGRVGAGYEGRKVTVWQSSPKNYNDNLAYKDLVKLGEAEVKDGRFVLTFPLYKKGSSQTQLSSCFIAEIDGVKVDKYFVIENYRDFNNDPDRFTVELKKTANVLDFGAKGDGFTDDTAAIQAAINAVRDAGGGRVIIPGDTGMYGRRYVITHIELCSNLEFVIEEGAVLWQSQREDELNKTVPVNQRGFNKVTYGHNVAIDGLVWCTGFSTVNLPLIFVNQCENVRITGGGTIRMNDVGGEVEDPFYFVGDAGLAVGQENRVQQIPLCIYSSKHVDITDLTLMRSNGWHCYMSFNDDVYIGNLTEKQAVNVTGDGFTITSCKNVTIDRCFTYTSDDAVGICTAYEDGRGQFYRPTKPEEDNATENIVIRHSYLFGGFGISWMPWGAAASNMYNQETRNVHIFDCSLGGHKSSGTWPDDPFYGWSSTNHYTQTEDNNYCPIKDVYFHDNEYLAGFDLTLNNIILKATNFIVTDKIKGTIYSSGEFLNGNFDKQVHKGDGFKDETLYKTGLSYWSSKGTVGTEQIGIKDSVTVDTNESIRQPDYAGYIKGDGELFQGLWLTYGTYDFVIKTKLLSGSAKLFVRDAITGKIIAEKTVGIGEDFTGQKVRFELGKSATVQLGISHSGSADDIVYLDDASVVRDASVNDYDVDGKKYVFDFDDGKADFNVKQSGEAKAEVKDGKLIVPADGEYKLMLRNKGKLNRFSVSADISVSKEKLTNAGIYIFASGAEDGQDKITAYNVQIESQVGSDEYIIKLFAFDGKYLGAIASGKTMKISDGFVRLKVVVKNDMIFVFADDSAEPVIAYTVEEGLSGNVGLRSQKCENVFDNVILVTDQFVAEDDIPTPPETGIDMSIAVACALVGLICLVAVFVAKKRKRSL